MSEPILGISQTDDNPDNHPLVTWREYLSRQRAAKIQQRLALVAQRDALNDMIRTVSAEISALETLKNKTGETR